MSERESERERGKEREKERESERERGKEREKDRERQRDRVGDSDLQERDEPWILPSRSRRITSGVFSLRSQIYPNLSDMLPNTTSLPAKIKARFPRFFSRIRRCGVWKVNS